MKFFGPVDFRLKSSNEELRKAVAELRTGYERSEIDEEQYISFLRQFSDYVEVIPPTHLGECRSLYVQIPIWLHVLELLFVEFCW